MNTLSPLLSRRGALALLAGATPAAGRAGSLPIDTGRQLFVDDFLIERTSLRRSFHKPVLYDRNPVLKPVTPMEMNGGNCPVASPFSDGVFYDPEARLFKMWYHAGWFDGIAYAESEDGLQWRRPALDIEPGTNRVIPVRPGYERDGAGVWLDHEAHDRRERFKLFAYFRRWKQNAGGAGSRSLKSAGGEVYTSGDGIHWTGPVSTGPCGDNTSLFYNPLRKKWVFSIRTSTDGIRQRSYREHEDFLRGAAWTSEDVVYWQAADSLDEKDPTLGYEPQLYKIDAAPYESLMLGLFAIFKGPPNPTALKLGTPKTNDLVLAYSRDGITWTRPDRTPFLACSRQPGTWNRGYLHAAGGCCLVVGEKLYFYFGAWSGVSPRHGSHMYAGGSTGVAMLRRDGFVSMDAADAPGELTTKPVVFQGKHLFVNANAGAGEVRVEALDEFSSPIRPFSAGNCTPLRVDRTIQPVRWKGANDLSRLAGRPVRFRFRLTNAQLYSFWISPGPDGASHGYMAGGGPGIPGARDTAGQAGASA